MMAEISQEARRVTDVIDEITGIDAMVSEIEHELSETFPDHPGDLQEEKDRLQHKANTITNTLKDEGIEIVYDGPRIQVICDSRPWLEYKQDADNRFTWFERKTERTHDE